MTPLLRMVLALLAITLVGRAPASALGQDREFVCLDSSNVRATSCWARSRCSSPERTLIAAMQKLRKFGFRYKNFDIAVALAGLRASVEPIRAVQSGKHRVFGVSLHSTLKLAAKAND